MENQWSGTVTDDRPDYGTYSLVKYQGENWVFFRDFENGDIEIIKPYKSTDPEIPYSTQVITKRVARREITPIPYFNWRP